MTLEAIQQAAAETLRELDFFNATPVLLEDEGNLPADWDKIAATKSLAVTVGAADFSPVSRNAHTPAICGMARFSVKVWERPAWNRTAGAPRAGRSAAEAAEAVACAVHLLEAGGGTVVCTGIGGVERAEDGTVVRTVGFEALVQLDGGGPAD